MNIEQGTVAASGHASMRHLKKRFLLRFNATDERQSFP